MPPAGSPRHAGVMSSLFTWRGIDDPDRLDHAVLTLAHDRLSGHGVSLTPSYASSWQLDVGAGWVTRSLHVSVQGRGWGRSLALIHDGDGGWMADASGWGDTALEPPGLQEPESLRGAIDCDLALCPVTNTMPIRRLGFLEHAVPDTTLVMAWVEMPSLRVLRSDQVYATGPAEAGRSVRYANSGGDFQADLMVDDDGIVVDYPHLARRVRVED